MSLVKDALLKKYKSKPKKNESVDSREEPIRRDSPTLEPFQEHHPRVVRFRGELTRNTPVTEEPTEEPVEESTRKVQTTNIDTTLSRHDIELLTTAEVGKIYFATDGGVYVGGENGRAVLKANLSPVFMSENHFEALEKKQRNTLYVIQCTDKRSQTYYKLFFNGVTLYNTDRYSDDDINKLLQNKQDKLESGKNIKTINNQSIVGPGNIDIPYIKYQGISGIVVLKESEYEDIYKPDPTTLYIIMPDYE
jgi:hypothetical protein